MEVQRERMFRARGFEKWLATTFSVAMEGPKKIVLVWVQEARHSVILVGEKGVGVYIATRVPKRCKHMFTPVRLGRPESG